ncbi:MAG: hypothetical protein WCK49_00540 [Myxococcaceae bacterium]
MQVASDCAITFAELFGLLSNCPALSPRYYFGNFPGWYQYIGCVGSAIGTLFQANICAVDMINYFGVDTPAAGPYRPAPQSPSDLLDTLSQALDDPALRRELGQILESALNHST